MNGYNNKHKCYVKTRAEATSNGLTWERLVIITISVCRSISDLKVYCFHLVLHLGHYFSHQSHRYSSHQRQ